MTVAIGVARRVLRARVVFLLMLLGFVLLMQTLPTVWSHAADAPASAPATGPLSPGLTLTFASAKGPVDVRDARLVALLVPAGAPASPFLAPGPFTATFTGVVATTIKDSYRFAAEGRGDLLVTLNEKKVLELHGDFAGKPTDLLVVKKGKNRLVVNYSAPADGEARLRLLWATEGKPLEPISPKILLHNTDDDLYRHHASIRMGRELIASMRCLNCHQGGEGATMPEIKQDAPNLVDLKQRLTARWLAYWVSNPKALRPTATMPRVFHDAPATDQPGAVPQAVDIAAYLGAADGAAPAVTADPAVLNRGARLFTGLGCVACHVAPGLDDSDPTLNRIPLKFVKTKFAGNALVEFLKAPQAHYAWIKMPNFHLTDDEAAALSVWLQSRCKDDVLPAIAQPGNAVNGEKLFASAGCLSCHAVGDQPVKAASAANLATANFSSGCAVPGGGKGVDYQFTTDQTQAMQNFVAADWKPALERDPANETATRQMASLRCTACHSIDSDTDDSIWSNLDSDIGVITQNLPPRPPVGETKGGLAGAARDKSGQLSVEVEPPGDQTRPPLTWTGEKLRPSWMKAFIAGDVPYKPRTWVFARMPSFTSRAELLAHGMPMVHGCLDSDEDRPAADPKLAEIGKSLTSQLYFGCVKCHSCGDQAALAPFEAYAPNLAHVSDRLRHAYFTHWMLNPQYFLRGTKMPSFAQSDGNTAYHDILGGVAANQFEAIWNYLQAGSKIVPTQ